MIMKYLEKYIQDDEKRRPTHQGQENILGIVRTGVPDYAVIGFKKVKAHCPDGEN